MCDFVAFRVEMREIISKVNFNKLLKESIRYGYRYSRAYFILVVVVVCTQVLAQNQFIMEDHRWIPLSFLIAGLVVLIGEGFSYFKD